jgi:3-dehydroquinate synthase
MKRRGTPEHRRDQADAASRSATAEPPAETTWHEQRFAVEYDFPVVFTSALFSPDNPVLVDVLCRREADRNHKCIVFVDEGVLAARPTLPAELDAYAKRHGNRMTLVREPIPVPGGEKIKLELHYVEAMQRQLADHRIDRHSYVIAIGGGAVLDAVGLVAATAHRGIRHIRVPTTVLSQNDSGVGVKNGVNLYGQKNFVGTFAPPFAVLNDLDFVEALPDRDKISGMAEAVKVSLIRDGEFFRWLERHVDDLVTFKRPAMAHMIRRCAELHMRQIGKGGDPFETGSARPLDFGHWAAHRLETLTHYHLRHGEAVAIGIALDTHYSVLAGLLDEEAEMRVRFVLEHLGFRLWHPALENMMPGGRHAVLEGLREFREHLGGELTITLLSDIGVGVEVHEMDEAKVLQSIAWLKERASA